MATKVDQASAVELRRGQTNVTTTSATVSASSPKVSKFGAKSGFVIPKNKLSGSLVPVFRGSGKLEASDTVKEEGTKKVIRKTKWGSDLSQDVAVRRGRTLAYQTRVEQITQQLKSGALEIEDDQGLHSPSQAPNQDFSSHKIDNEWKMELLELERREAIGEILLLNPSYKAPPDYKPLLKEAKVPIPLKAYPGYNFIGLILGPESNTQKRLEEETGAKIRVHGTKAGTGEKSEITQADGNEAQGVYEELFVHVSADTFEKVDAAVALIELLVTPVSGNSTVVSTTSASGDNVNVLNENPNSSTGFMIPMAVINQGVVQPMMLAGQPGTPQVHFQPYPGPWVPLGPPHSPMRPPSGFNPAPNSVPIPTNPIWFPPSSPTNPFNMPPFFGGRPPTTSGFGSVPRNPSLVASRPYPPMQALQRAFMPEARLPNQVGPPRSNPMPGPQPPPFVTTQPTSMGPAPPIRPSVPSMTQPVSTVQLGPLPNRPSMYMPAAGNSAGWSSSAPSSIVPPTLRPGNNMQMAPSVPPQRPNLPVPQSIGASVAPPSNMPAIVVNRPQVANIISQATFPYRPPTAQSPSNRPAVPVAPAFTSVPPNVGARPPVLSSSAQSMVSSAQPVSALAHAPTPRPLPMPAPKPAPSPVFPQALVTPSPIFTQAPASIQSCLPATPIQPVRAQAPVPIISLNPVGQPPTVSSASPRPLPPPLQAPSPVAGGPQSFSPLKPLMTSTVSIPPVTAPKPQRPSSGDFTFQPHRPQLPVSQAIPRPNSVPAAQNTPSMPPAPSSQQPLSAPQAPSFRLAVNKSEQLGFPRPQTANQIGQNQAPAPPPPSPGSTIPFNGNPTITRPPPRIPVFLNPRPVPPTPVLQMRPPRFPSTPQVPNLPGSLPIRPGISPQLQHNQLPHGVPNQQQFSNTLGYGSSRPALSPSGGNQIYDPFSPTSIPSTAEDPAKARRQENDPEYEDLMASVGVR